MIKNTKQRSTIAIDQPSKLSSLGPTQTSGWIQGQHLPAQSSDIDELELAAAACRRRAAPSVRPAAPLPTRRI
jgi:hypothetical protein